jgi:large subunit ribosomal protein L10
MRKEKQLLLDDISEQLTQFEAFVITSYQGLSANKANSLRTEMAKHGSSVEVIRKRVLIKAALKAGLSLNLAELPGHIAIVFSGKDPIETTKAVFKFSQDNKQVLEVVGGRIEGKLYSGQDVEKLSKLPGKDEMRAQLLSVLEAPMSQTLAVMEAVLTSVVYCLDNKCKQSSSDNN